VENTTTPSAIPPVENLEENIFENSSKITQKSRTDLQQNNEVEMENLYANLEVYQDLKKKPNVPPKKPVKVPRQSSNNRMPVPAPRHKSESVTTLKGHQDRMGPQKPTLAVKPNLAGTREECYGLKKMNRTVPIPPPQQTKYKPLDETIVSKNAGPCRPAPPPPAHTLPHAKPQTKQKGNQDPNANTQILCHGLVKNEKPLKMSVPPLSPLNICAELQFIIGAKREFEGPPTDAVFLEKNIIVLDGAAGKLVFFNKHGKVIKSYRLTENKAGMILKRI